MTDLRVDGDATPLVGGLPYRVERRVLAGIPCLVERPAEGVERRALCLVHHGAWAAKEGKLGIYSALAARGTVIVIPDAPLHGERRGETPSGVGGRDYVWDSVRRSVLEAPALLDQVEAEFGSLPLRVVGSSMGGYVALTLARRERRVQRAAALITSGLWNPDEVSRPELRTFISENRPVDRADDFPPIELLLLSGAQDQVFPPNHHQQTAAALRTSYARAGVPERFQEAVLPGVQHYTSEWMRDRVVAFFLRP